MKTIIDIMDETCNQSTASSASPLRELAFSKLEKEGSFDDLLLMVDQIERIKDNLLSISSNFGSKVLVIQQEVHALEVAYGKRDGKQIEKLGRRIDAMIALLNKKEIKDSVESLIKSMGLEVSSSSSEEEAKAILGMK